MLSVKNLVKVYKTKGGTEVRALDGVSVEFPETGMVFLLGRSGSGKSTLLNVAGGLDKPDSGEVIVKGKSSKDFSGSDFDSYRNTFVGFVFQEYNILNEFNIEQNIALALQLQGKKNDKEAVNALLEKVDLAGMGKRKPNTLSGGQKQRVAIARALIKEPQIIMADEPTGALDSNTGKQVLDTLKKLSETKLVIIVSHDREFAEQYGDRIIELKDGKILTDTTKAYAVPSNVSENVNAIGGDTVRIKDLDKLTKTELDEIFTMLKGKGKEVIITSSQTDLPAVKRACKITDDGSREYFRETSPENICLKQYDGADTKFIKSRLPIGHAIKMGASGLKTKPVRLFFTILISIISFTLFGVLLTMMMYNPIYSISQAMKDTGYNTALLAKYYSAQEYSYTLDMDGNRSNEYTHNVELSDRISEAELAEMNNNGRGIKFAGVYAAKYNDCSYANYLGADTGKHGDGDYIEYPTSSFCGFTDCGERFMAENNFNKLAGKYPVEANEIAVSQYVYDQFKDRGYRRSESTDKINNYDDLLGKEINFFDNYGRGTALKIVGIYNVGDYLSKYETVLKGTTTDKSSKEYMAKKAECTDVLTNGFYSLAFVSDKFYEENKSKFSYNESKIIHTDLMYGTRLSLYKDPYYNDDIREYDYTEYFSEETVKNNADSFTVFSIDGDKKDSSNFTIGENDAYVSLYELFRTANNMIWTSKDYEVFYDKDGNIEYNKRNGWTEENRFWTNYAGEVSFEEKPGYSLIEGENPNVYINKNGQTASWNEIENMYEWCEYYADNNGNITLDRPDDSRRLLYISYGQYFTDGKGNYSMYGKSEEWTEKWGEYYERFDGGSTVYLEFPDGYFIAENGFVNRNDPSEIVKDKFENWRQVNCYYTFPDGTLSSVQPEDYYISTNFYYNPETGELSLNEKEGWNLSDGFYVDSKGNATVEQGNNWNATRVYGIFINENGKLSLTKKAGYTFYSEWLYNANEQKFLFAKSHNGYYVNDKTGEKVCDPAIDYAQPLYYKRVNLRYAEMNKEFYEAYKRFAIAMNTYNFEDEVTGELTDADITLIIGSIKRDWTEWRSGYEDSESGGLPEKLFARNRNNAERELDIKGFFLPSFAMWGNTYIISSAFASSFMVVPPEGYSYYVTEYKTNYVAPADLKYNYIIAKSDALSEDVYFMLEDKDNAVSYKIEGNEIYDGAQTAISMIELLSLIFLIVGLVMAVLSALLLFNFISTSISAKRKEIGVLRAVGARGTDVFKIFFAEAFIIAMICFAISAVAAGVLCYVLNGLFAGAISISVLNYGVLEVLLILGISFVVAVIATILPVYFAAKKPPVESIRAL